MSGDDAAELKGEGAFSVSAWAWFPAVITILPLLTLASVAFEFGTGTSIGGRVQISDALEWLRCGEVLLDGPLTALNDVPWCLRRPEVFVVRAPLQALAGSHVATLVVAQTGILALAWAAFFFELIRGGFVCRRGVLIAAALALFPSWRASIGTGAEWAGLTLSVSAVAAAFRVARDPTLVVGALAVALAGLAYRARPGNPLLVAALVLFVATFLKPKHGRARSGAVVILSLGLGLHAVTGSLTSLGVRDAGHGGNVWGTLYAAAVDEVAHYKDAYEECARVGKLGERACWPHLREATKAAVVEDPRPFLRQLAANFVAFAVSGPLSRALAPESMRGLPHSITALAADLTSDVWFAVLANLVLAVLWCLLSLVVIRRGARALPKFVRALFAGRAHEADRGTWLLFLIICVSIGAAGVFALLGHDDGRRHLTTNTPLLVLMPSLLSVRGRALTVDAPLGVRRVVAAISFTVLVSVALASSIARESRESIDLAQDCAPHADRDVHEVNASVSLSTQARRPRFLLGASDVHAADVRALEEGELVLARASNAALTVFFIPARAREARAFCRSSTASAPETALQIVGLVPYETP